MYTAGINVFQDSEGTITSAEKTKSNLCESRVDFHGDEKKMANSKKLTFSTPAILNIFL